MEVASPLSKTKLALGVLASGNGSNLQAIIDACREGKLDASVEVVITDNAEAKALERARRHGISSATLRASDYADRTSFDRAALEILHRHQVDIVALAGYMRIVSPAFIGDFKGRIVNVHPSLLPSFPGLDAVGQALAYGVKVTGCTVHLVDEGVDTGPPLVQYAVDISPVDTHDSLAEKIHVLEHKAYIKALQILIQKINGEDEKDDSGNKGK
jgi:phosphoribosylglycinamide formyltransferase-1